VILREDGRVRLTRHEINMLRRYAARQGRTIGVIETVDELFAAVLDGLPPSIAANLLDFLETNRAQPTTEPHQDQRSPDSGRGTTSPSQDDEAV
jgi:hypothetical protein